MKVVSVEAAEFVAAREALSFALEAGFRNVILEGNNTIVISALQPGEMSVGSGGAIVDDIGVVFGSLRLV